MAKPDTYDTPVPGWPGKKPWRELVFDLDCSTKPSAAQYIDINGCDEVFNYATGQTYSDCSAKPGLQNALSTATQWCEDYVDWRASSDAAQEKLGAEHGIDFETANMLIMDPGANVDWSPLTAKEVHTFRSFWAPPTQASFRDLLVGTPDITPFIPIWNKLSDGIRLWFCIYRPWVPVVLYKQEQEKARRTAAIVKATGTGGTLKSKVGMKGVVYAKGKAPASTAMKIPFCVDTSQALKDTAKAIAQTQAAAVVATQEHLVNEEQQIQNIAAQAHVDHVAKFRQRCTPGEEFFHKGVRYICEDAQARAIPDSEGEPSPQFAEDDTQDEGSDSEGGEAAPNILPVVLGGLGLVTGGPLGGAAGYALGSALAPKDDANVGFMGPPETGKTYAQKQREAEVAECTAFVQYVRDNGLNALADGLQALPHNNADYIAQLNQLTPEDKERAFKCAYVASEILLEQSWADLTPEEKKAHTAQVKQKLDEATKGKKGTTVVCPPGTPPAQCKDQIEAAIDEQTCNGVSIPLGPKGLNACLTYELMAGSAIGLGILVKNKWVAGAGALALLALQAKKR